MNDLRILGLDTSGKTASVAILDTEQGILLGEHTIYTSRTHSQVILPLCKQLLEECRMTPQDVDCYAVAVGPGSYTGLRIGIAAVQGMAMVHDTPCVGVSTLEAMASRIYGAPQILSLMHARADLFYCGWFSYRYSMSDAPHGVERMIPDELQTVSEIAEVVQRMEEPVILVGDGAEEFMKQYTAISNYPTDNLHIAPPMLRLQSAAGVCTCAAWKDKITAQELTASYLQAVQVQKAAGRR
ncbi:MAG: tRNA (adenosine(37)-N6)-threonylcarbamoyltransferase complex dimerization subunit type 1 TsaB [Ruminococcus sp.]|nr:tRNA (adenosine(37)-N6)-threonylcarbamoyltransferase complex dimerization subunit type 1 TsaB [Ruminococcus sp.]